MEIIFKGNFGAQRKNKTNKTNNKQQHKMVSITHIVIFPNYFRFVTDHEEVSVSVFLNCTLTY